MDENQQALNLVKAATDKRHEIDLLLKGMRRKHDALRNDYKQLLEKHAQTVKKLQDVGFIDGRGVQRHAIKPLLRGGQGEALAQISCSDVHAFCRVRKQDTQGFNEYNPGICKARLDRLWRKGLALINIERHGQNINRLVIAFLGDLLENMIHPDAQETNYGTPAQEVVFLRDIVYSGIDFLIHKGGFKQITLLCVVGNHDRDSKKMQHTNAAERSYLKMFYDYLLRDYADPKTGMGKHGKVDLEVVVAGGAKHVENIYGRPHRYSHRSEFRYSGGVGGPTVGINRVLSRELPVECDFSGHLHHYLPLPKCVANGSVIGHSSFSDWIGVKPERPQQALTIIDKERAVTLVRPIFVDAD